MRKGEASGKKRSTEEQKQMRRQEIIDAGLEMFRASSYEAVNIINVTQAVGIAKGTFYLYFKSKEELFLAIINDLFEKWFDDMDQLATLIKQVIDENEMAPFDVDFKTTLLDTIRDLIVGMKLNA